MNTPDKVERNLLCNNLPLIYMPGLSSLVADILRAPYWKLASEGVSSTVITACN